MNIEMTPGTPEQDAAADGYTASGVLTPAHAAILWAALADRSPEGPFKTLCADSAKLVMQLMPMTCGHITYDLQSGGRPGTEYCTVCHLHDTIRELESASPSPEAKLYL